MRRWGLVAAAAVVVLSNLVALLGVAWNRSGEPDAEIVLTEREAPLAWNQERESSAVSLRLEWSGPDLGPGDGTWFDEDKLKEIGFDTAVPPGASDGPAYYLRQLPRQTYVALEYEGDGWKRRLEAARRRVDEAKEKAAAGVEGSAEVEGARKALEWAEKTTSRLVAIDAGNDPGALRDRHPDRSRVAVVPAIVQASTRVGTPPREGVAPPVGIQGFIQSVLVSSIHVPRDLAATLSSIGLRSAPADPPRYAVTLRFGRRYEPWVVDIRPLPAP